MPTPTGPEPPAAAGRGRLADPLVPLTGLVALAVYVLNGFEGKLIRDVGIYSYAGQQLADGVPPYVSVLNRAGPLAQVLPGVAAWVAERLGVDEVVGMRVLFALLSAGAVAASYVLARDLFRSRAAGVAGAAALLALEGFTFYATNGPREKTTMVLLTTLALVAVVRRRWATAGALVSLATLTWQPVLFAALPAAAAAALLQPRERLRSLARFVVGGLAPLALAVAAFALIGRLRLFWEDFFLINLRYTTQGSLLDHPSRFVDAMATAYGWSALVIAAGLLLQLAWAVLALRSPVRHEPQGAAQVGLGLFTLANLVWAHGSFNAYPDAFVAFPGVVAGVAGLVAPLARRLDPRAVTAVVAAWATVVVALSAGYTVTTRDTTLVEQRRQVRAVVAALPPGSRLLSQGAPQSLVLSHQRNPTRLQIFGNGLSRYVEDTWPGGVPGYCRWVAAQRPAAVTVGRQRMLRCVTRLLHTSYERVGRSPGWAWFVRRDVGRATLERIRGALGRARVGASGHDVNSDRPLPG